MEIHVEAWRQGEEEQPVVSANSQFKPPFPETINKVNNLLVRVYREFA